MVHLSYHEDRNLTRKRFLKDIVFMDSSAETDQVPRDTSCPTNRTERKPGRYCIIYWIQERDKNIKK